LDDDRLNKQADNLELWVIIKDYDNHTESEPSHQGEHSPVAGDCVHSKESIC